MLFCNHITPSCGLPFFILIIDVNASNVKQIWQCKSQAFTIIFSLHLVGCETESKQAVKHSKISFASLRTSQQSTPFSFPTWYAAAVIPNLRRMFSISAKAGISTFFLLSYLFEVCPHITGTLSLQVLSASNSFLWFTISEIIVSNSCCCNLRSSTTRGFKPLFFNSLDTCIQLYWWNSSCGTTSSFQLLALCVANVNATSVTMNEFLLMNSTGVTASTWSSIKV